MKYTHLIREVYGKPWLITGSAHSAICRLLDARFKPQAADRPATDICGDAVEVPVMQVQGSVAVIPVAGVLGRKLSPIERGAGCCDFGDIVKDLEEAQANPAVQSVLLHIDSPGGTVSGTLECAQAIKECSKPVYTFTDGDCCSAAYWLASQTVSVLATSSACLGSIGVYVPHYDVSRAYEMQGVEVDLITSGSVKGAGYPGTSLTPEQRAEIQSGVDELGSMFRSTVAASRPVIAADMEGQVFMGAKAVEKGFADILVKDLASCLRVISNI